MLEVQESQSDKGHIRVPFIWNFLGIAELSTCNSEPLNNHQ